MRTIEKLNLIRNISDKIAKDFQDESEIEFFLKDQGFNNKDLVYKSIETGYNDWENYLSVKDTLLNTNNEKVLKKVADELEISQNLSNLIKKFPDNWKHSSNLKLFISHSDKNKDSAIKLKTALIDYKIDAFVAHEDIKTSKAWREQIKLALSTMDLFVSLNNENFNNSQFCQQELGFAVSRNVDIVQLMGKNKNKSNLPKGLGEELQFYVPRELEDAVNKIVNIARDSDKIGSLYNEINPLSVRENDEDEIPF